MLPNDYSLRNMYNLFNDNTSKSIRFICEND